MNQRIDHAQKDTDNSRPEQNWQYFCNQPANSNSTIIDPHAQEANDRNYGNYSSNDYEWGQHDWVADSGSGW